MKKSYCRLLEVSPDHFADIICEMNVRNPIPDDYIQPIAEAITERLTGYYLNGSWNPAVRRWTRREANNIKCFI